jgi:hypothetical protein
LNPALTFADWGKSAAAADAAVAASDEREREAASASGLAPGKEDINALGA